MCGSSFFLKIKLSKTIFKIHLKIIFSQNKIFKVKTLQLHSPQEKFQKFGDVIYAEK